MRERGGARVIVSLISAVTLGLGATGAKAQGAYRTGQIILYAGRGGIDITPGGGAASEPLGPIRDRSIHEWDVLLRDRGIGGSDPRQTFVDVALHSQFFGTLNQVHHRAVARGVTSPCDPRYIPEPDLAALCRGEDPGETSSPAGESVAWFAPFSLGSWNREQVETIERSLRTLFDGGFDSDSRLASRTFDAISENLDTRIRDLQTRTSELTEDRSRTGAGDQSRMQDAVRRARENQESVRDLGARARARYPDAGLNAEPALRAILGPDVHPEEMRARLQSVHASATRVLDPTRLPVSSFDAMGIGAQRAAAWPGQDARERRVARDAARTAQAFDRAAADGQLPTDRLTSARVSATVELHLARGAAQTTPTEPLSSIPQWLSGRPREAREPLIDAMLDDAREWRRFLAEGGAAPALARFRVPPYAAPSDLRPIDSTPRAVQHTLDLVERFEPSAYREAAFRAALRDPGEPDPSTSAGRAAATVATHETMLDLLRGYPVSDEDAAAVARAAGADPGVRERVTNLLSEPRVRVRATLSRLRDAPSLAGALSAGHLTVDQAAGLERALSARGVDGAVRGLDALASRQPEAAGAWVEALDTAAGRSFLTALGHTSRDIDGHVVPSEAQVPAAVRARFGPSPVRAVTVAAELDAVALDPGDGGPWLVVPAVTGSHAQAVARFGGLVASTQAQWRTLRIPSGAQLFRGAAPAVEGATAWAIEATGTPVQSHPVASLRERVTQRAAHRDVRGRAQVIVGTPGAEDFLRATDRLGERFGESRSGPNPHTVSLGAGVTYAAGELGTTQQQLATTAALAARRDIRVTSTTRTGGAHARGAIDLAVGADHAQSMREAADISRTLGRGHQTILETVYTRPDGRRVQMNLVFYEGRLSVIRTGPWGDPGLHATGDHIHIAPLE